jgi:hypothetical protein
MANNIQPTEIMRYGYRYELNQDWKNYFSQFVAEIYINGERVKYDFAEPVRYADNCIVGNCWIVDSKGKKHPGFNVSPIPLHISSLSNPVKIHS